MKGRKRNNVRQKVIDKTDKFLGGTKKACFKQCMWDTCLQINLLFTIWKLKPE